MQQSYYNNTHCCGSKTELLCLILLMVFQKRLYAKYYILDEKYRLDKLDLINQFIKFTILKYKHQIYELSKIVWQEQIKLYGPLIQTQFSFRFLSSKKMTSNEFLQIYRYFWNWYYVPIFLLFNIIGHSLHWYQTSEYKRRGW